MGAVIERFEEAEGRNPGETSISDLPRVLKLKKELCDSQVKFQEYAFSVFCYHQVENSFLHYQYPNIAVTE